jgi:hypothetical protein
MRIPRLTEVFLITEVSAGNIIRILGVPKDIAELFVQIDRKAAFAMAKVTKLLYVGEGYTFQEKFPEGSEVTLKWIKDWISAPGSLGHDFLRLFKKYPEFIKIVSSNSMNDYQQLMNTMSEFASKEYEGVSDNAERILDMKDGWHWVKLKPEECGLEGKRMQHCGDVRYDGYSLRDPQGKPHVTVDVNGNTIEQLKGKQNTEPPLKYWQFIKELIEYLGVEESVDTELSADFIEFMGLSPGDPANMTWQQWWWGVMQALNRMESDAEQDPAEDEDLTNMGPKAYEEGQTPQFFATVWDKFWTQREHDKELNKKLAQYDF